MKAVHNLNIRWADLIVEKKEEIRTPDEIKSGIKSKLRRLSKNGNGSV